jgi:glycosyltransferase involved in cell wall biosynthesis
MKVGVFLPGQKPEEGGGYTFEQDIIQALLELASQSNHRFVIFLQGSPPAHFHALPHSQVLGVYEMASASSLPTKVAGKLKRLWDRNGTNLSYLDFAARKCGIDFMWFLTPHFQPVSIPYAATAWDLQHRLQPWFPEVGLQREWRRREDLYTGLFQRATCIITGTNAGRDEISYFYQVPLGQIRLLPHPTPSFAERLNEQQVQSILSKYGLSKRFLLYPAQFWPHKNHANLLLALRLLHDKYRTDIDLVFTGSDQGNRPYVQELARRAGLEKRVHFLGFVSREELTGLYQGAVALAFVTFFGPENLPPLEAFSLGCPVIASRVSGADEQLGEAALLVDPRDPEAIAQAVMALLDDPARRNALVERGHQRAAGWTATDFVQGVFAILDEFEPVRRTWE